MNALAYICITKSLERPAQDIKVCIKIMKNSTYIFVPFTSSNRTAFLSKLVQRTENNFKDQDLNGVYPVAPFEFWERDSKYYSENPNCCTPYLLVEAPEWFSTNDLGMLSVAIEKGLGKDYGKSTIRAIKASREALMIEIIEIISKIREAIENNKEIDFASPMVLRGLKLDYFIAFNKIYIYQESLNKYTRF